MRKYVLEQRFLARAGMGVTTLTWNDSPSVEFCGYTIPHPSEPRMNIRIQTFGTIIQYLGLPLLALILSCVQMIRPHSRL